MKKFRLLNLLVVLALILAACGGGGAEPATDAPAADAPAAEAPAAEAPAAEAPTASDGALEAPMLAAKVAAGELPPLEERLPKTPRVVGPGTLMVEEHLPDWTPGQYLDGSVIRTAHSVADWAPDVFVMLNEPALSAPDLGVQGIEGNVLESFEVSDDNTVFTFHMREGLKWSDGEPVTTEDVRFTWESIYGNEKLTPAGLKARFRVGNDPKGEPGVLEIADDYTFTISYPSPYGGFLRNLVIEGWNGSTELINPAHVLKQWHIDYTPIEEMADELAANNLTDEWYTLFGQKWCQNWDVTRERCIGYPTINPWVLQPSDSPSTKIFERNPYYFKVDTEGKQLPYIDKIISQQVEDVEAVNLKVLTGEVDFLRESTGLVKVPLYKENEESAGFNTVLLDMHVDSSTIFLNMTYDDPVWQSVVQDVRFRQALSHAIDRDEIIESIYYGFASYPDQTVGAENATYDVELANSLLDEMGMTERDADGFRMAPDGSPFTMLVEHGAHAPDLEPIAELLSEQMKDVGINFQIKRIDSQLWGQRRDANELQATVFWAHDQNGDNDRLMGNIGLFGRAWLNWFNTGGSEGVEPPTWVQDAFAMNKARWESVAGGDEYNAFVEQGHQWQQEYIPQITIVENVKYPMIASKRLRNVPSAGYAIAGNFAGEQLWYAE
ncbi:MAG TPA: ABC transporter substrate-binding protein [Caldilineaceae bacterium]|nr:ABC transporter substrate-binding protein [Caldilineaceae bacterium]